MEIRISIIIPVYNTEKWLRECLDSIVNQILPFDEVIIVNDGSTDGSPAICRFYADNYDFIKLIDQENQGVSVARNIGMQKVSYEYVMFLDSDDYLRIDAVMILKKLLEKAKYDAVFYDADIHCMDGYEQIGRNIYDRSHSKLDGNMQKGLEYFFRCYPRDYVVSPCMAVYKKEIIDNEKIMFPENIYYEDNYFSYKFLNHAQKVIHISEKLYQRRYRENSTMTSPFTEKKFVDFIKICGFIWTEIDKNIPCEMPEQRKILFAFVCDDFVRILKNYQTCLDQNIMIGGEARNLLEQTAEEYLFIISKLVPNILSLDLAMLNRILYAFHCMQNWKIGWEMDLLHQINRIVDRQKSLYKNILQELPFGETGKTVGIYGTGKHTEGVLAIYQRVIGPICCNLIFIDSKKDDVIYQKRKLINYQKIKDMNFDMIVISSFIYEREMIAYIREISSEVPVYTFYNQLNGDIFSEYKIFLGYCE